MVSNTENRVALWAQSLSMCVGQKSVLSPQGGVMLISWMLQLIFMASLTLASMYMQYSCVWVIPETSHPQPHPFPYLHSLLKERFKGDLKLTQIYQRKSRHITINVHVYFIGYYSQLKLSCYLVVCSKCQVWVYKTVHCWMQFSEVRRWSQALITTVWKVSARKSWLSWPIHWPSK